MLLNIYSIYDVKAHSFAMPFYAPNNAVAIRLFTQLANDPASQVHSSPDDFSLFDLGTFDDDGAHFSIHKKPKVVANAVEFIKTAAPTLTTIAGTQGA